MVRELFEVWSLIGLLEYTLWHLLEHPDITCEHLHNPTPWHHPQTLWHLLQTPYHLLPISTSLPPWIQWVIIGTFVLYDRVASLLSTLLLLLLFWQIKGYQSNIFRNQCKIIEIWIFKKPTEIHSKSLQHIEIKCIKIFLRFKVEKGGAGLLILSTG